MPSRYTTLHGIVLKRRNYGEADRVLTILTREEGKISVLAKGVRKLTSRRAGHIEVFSHARFMVYKTSRWDTLGEVSRIGKQFGGEGNLSKVSMAYYICELVDKLLPECQEHPDIYDLLLDIFHTLTTISDIAVCSLACDTVSLAFLRNLGYLPEDQTIHSDRIKPYIESIIERKLRSPDILTKIVS